MADGVSIQESLYPELTCFGCGHANPNGFHLRSYRDGDLTVAEFTPRPEHDNGFGFLNGGIITTVLDCHGAAVVLWEAAQHEWLAAPGAPLPFITAGFDVRFLRPTPLGPTVRLTAFPASLNEAEIFVTSELEVDGKPRGSHDRHVASLPPAHVAPDRKRSATPLGNTTPTHNRQSGAFCRSTTSATSWPPRPHRRHRRPPSLQPSRPRPHLEHHGQLLGLRPRP